MAERPRAGLERIALYPVDGEPTRLIEQSVDLNDDRETFSQRVFLSAPDGRHLVYAARGGGLRLRGPDGEDERIIERVYDRDVRFSADGRRLATLVADGEGPLMDTAQVTVVDLASGERRGLGSVYGPRWLEWVRAGVVVGHFDEAADRPVLTYFPLAGRPRQLVSREGLEARFTAAARGTRVLFFTEQVVRDEVQRSIFAVDVSGGAPSPAGALPGPLANVEMSPDGSQAAIATADALFRWSAAGLERLESRKSVHSIWYSPSGRELAYATRSAAVLLAAGGERHELHAPAGDLVALRFNRGGDGLVVVRGDRALLWQPAAAGLRTLAVSPPGQTLHGADVFRGATVLWTTAPASRPPGKRNARAQARSLAE